ncbi:MAG: S8 family serine peptidase, partial [Planctomycetota bacterium]
MATKSTKGPAGDKGMEEPTKGAQIPAGEIKEEASEMPAGSMSEPGMGESATKEGEMPAGSMVVPAATSEQMPKGGMGEPAAASEQVPKGGMGEPEATPVEMPTGGMVEAAPRSKKHSDTAEGEPQAVLVELHIPVSIAASDALQMADGLGVSGFQMDTSYDPVPINPTPDQDAKLAAAGEKTIIIRGMIEESKIPQLEAQANVVKVWRDTRIEPFVDTLTKEKQTAFVMPMDGFGTCPIGTCDCSPGTAKGTIADVAKYLGVDKIWAAGYRGDSIVVGVVDGGITAQGRTISSSDTSNPSWPGKLIPRVTGGWPTTSWGTTGVAWGWHGNMCSTDVLGMAPKTQIYDIRISAGGLAATISAAISGFQWAIKQHKLNGTPHILTNSWGIFQEAWDTDYARNPLHPFTRKVVEALDEGILVLFAAGNCGGTCPDNRCGSDTGPGKSIWGANSHPRVMTVGAVNKKEQFVGYSSQGPGALDKKKPDFCSVTHFKGFFSSDSGTSAATPIAAGVVALLKQSNPALSQNQVKNALKQTAKDIGPPGWDQHSGAGIIRPKAAFRAVRKQANGRLEVFVRGANKALWHKWQVAPNNGWSGWASMGGWIDLLAAGRNADGRLEVFVRGANGSLWHKWQVAPNNGWSGWASMGGWIDRLDVGQNEDGRLEVFVRGADKALWHKWQVAPNDGWSGWASMGGWIDLLAVGRNA